MDFKNKGKRMVYYISNVFKRSEGKWFYGLLYKWKFFSSYKKRKMLENVEVLIWNKGRWI